MHFRNFSKTSALIAEVLGFPPRKGEGEPHTPPPVRIEAIGPRSRRLARPGRFEAPGRPTLRGGCDGARSWRDGEVQAFDRVSKLCYPDRLSHSSHALSVATLPRNPLPEAP